MDRQAASDRGRSILTLGTGAGVHPGGGIGQGAGGGGAFHQGPVEPLGQKIPSFIFRILWLLLLRELGLKGEVSISLADFERCSEVSMTISAMISMA